MKRKLSVLSGRYLTALRKHLKQSPEASLEVARELGRQAVAIGLETLQVAQIHHRALAALETCCSKDGIIERADIFFTEAITAIEETHRAALSAKARLSQLHKKLDQSTEDLAASKRSLKEGIAQRRSAEVALKKSGEHYKKQLQESLALQKHLQHLTRQILTAQEEKRKQISHELQDEIVQTLLGINVRILTLKTEAGHNAQSLQKEIASTQQLVDVSVKTIERVARAFDKPHEP